MAFFQNFYNAVSGKAAGNGSDPITRFHSVLGKYPGNNKQWWAAKAQADDDEKKIKEGDFLPKVLDKVFSGNNRAPRGHYLLNAFRKERGAVSGIGADVEAVQEKNYRPNTTCFFSGRVWWAAGDRVYYSQILDHKSKAGLCYQEADPTSEDISDLIASDGGTLQIAEANNIHRIIPLANGVMAFSSTGVWFISGGSSAFSATDITLDKVSAVGTDFPRTIVQVNDMIFWWSEIGINAIEQASGQFGPIPGKFGNNNISEATIQSMYNEIPEDSKKHAKGIFDPKYNVIQWIYSSDSSNPKTYDRVLNFDVTIQAFYPWSISEPTTGVNKPKVRGVSLTTNLLREGVEEEVLTTVGTNVTTISLDNVDSLVYNTTVEDRPTNVLYLTTSGSDLTFSTFTNRNFVDWESFDTVGVPYSSYVETGFELLEDTMRKKQAIRVFVHFRRTEDDASNPPSSCTMRTKWDWTSNSNANKWSRAIEAYRPKTMRLPTTADFESGFPVVTSNNKVRGSGKAIQFRFECGDAGKNFDLLGWSVAYVGNTEP